MTRHLAIATVIALSTIAVVAKPPTVTALPAGGAIAIDGKLDEPAWEAGEWSSDFSFLDMPERRPGVQTSFKVRFDSEAVYFGIRAHEPTPGTMKLGSRIRDQHVWNDDCVEIMLDPTGERIEYYHIIVNGLGTVYDAQMRQGGNVRSVEWDCNVKTATAIGDNAWTAEFRLPLIELGLNASSIGNWALNVTRARRTQGIELSSYAPLTGGFHQPSLFAALTMREGDFGRFLWDIKPPYDAEVMPEGDALVHTAKIHVRNSGPAFRFFRVRGTLRESTGAWVTDGLDKGQARELTIRVPLKQQGKQVFTLELADRKSGALLSVRKFQADLSYTPILLDVRRPWYRNSIYATETINAIECVATIALRDEELGKLRLRAALHPAGQDGAAAPALAEQTIPAVQKKVSISLPIPKLPDGAYALHVTLENRASGAPAHSVTTTIHKLPAVPEEWRIDERNVLRHNGEEVLPFGWFSIPAEAMAEKGHAYRLMQAYSTQYKRSREAARTYLDTITAAGTHVTVYPYPNNAMMTPSSVWGKPLSDDEAVALRNRLNDIKDHPAVFAWYMADEPELRPALPERTRALYQVCQDTDPYHPCIMLNDTIAGIFKYVDAGDILMPDPYPCFIQGGLAAQPIEKTGKFIKACQEASKGRKAIWITPQGFNYGDYGKKNQRGPNVTELRNQLYQAVAYGAKGFIWYTHSHTANYPDLDLGMRWLSFEVADLKPAILANPADNVTVKIDAPHPEHIHVSPRHVNGHLTIFAVNTATTPQDVTLTLSGAGVAKPGPFRVVSEGRDVLVASGTAIRDRFDTYQTHIYTTDPAPPRRSTLMALRSQIAKANAARKQPGNLAFEDAGTTVAVSSKARYGSTPDRVTDGIRTGMRWRSGTQAKGGDWLVLRWPAPQRIGRLVVFSSTIASCDIQIPDGDDWKTVGKAAAMTDDQTEITLTPVTSAAVRVLVTGLRPEQKIASIREVEAYAE